MRAGSGQSSTRRLSPLRLLVLLGSLFGRKLPEKEKVRLLLQAPNGLDDFAL
jgi:hypothetical protein